MSELAAIERFLYREADCLDRADLDQWFDLYTDDATYWMPVAAEQTDPLSHISLFYDDRLLMEIRRRNFGHQFAASMEYPVRCSHLIGNVRLVEQAQDDVSIRVKSNFQTVVFYKEQHLYAGVYTHDLVSADGDYKIRHKRVDLINADAEQGNLIIYI